MFGSPLGNPLGDTAIAVQHVIYLKRLFANAQIHVSTSDSAVWKSLGAQDVEYTGSPEPLLLKAGVDLAILDWVTVGRDFTLLLAKRARAAMYLGGMGGRSYYRLGTRKSVYLPRIAVVNHTTRLADFYQMLSGQSLTACRYLKAANAKRGSGYLANFFASTAEKSIPPVFAKVILRALATTCGDADMSYLNVPPDTNTHEGLVHRSLRTFVAQALSPACLCAVEKMNIESLVDTIKNARIVIGPDSATQHIAGHFGVPSISCYPANSYYRYLFWGQTDRIHIAVRLPGTTGKNAVTEFSELLTFLSERLLTSERPCRLYAVKFRDIEKRFAGICCTALKTKRSNEKTLANCADQLFEDLKVRLNVSWAAPVIDEMRAFFGGIISTKHPIGKHDVAVVRLRLSYLNALKILRLF